MSKEKDRVMRHWFNFEPYEPSGVNMHTDGWTVRSWHTAIAYHEEGPTVWINTTNYTSYTSRHQHTVRRFVSDHVEPNDIVIVHMLPWDVYGIDLKRYATEVNPQKRVDFQDVMRSLQIKAAELRHDLKPFDLEYNSFNYGVWTTCKLCGYGARLKPVQLYDKWSLHNRHFEMQGNALRYRCNPRLQPIQETILTDEEWKELLDYKS